MLTWEFSDVVASEELLKNCFTAGVPLLINLFIYKNNKIDCPCRDFVQKVKFSGLGGILVAPSLCPQVGNG